MLNAPYKYVVYRIRLVKSERDFFGNPISSDELDVIAKALENDLHQKEVFKFVHPKNGDVTYERKYKLCPVNGNTILLVGQMRKPLDMAQVRITLRSHYYKVPYVVLEHYTPAFRNPEILREMITRAFNWVLEKYGLEVMLEPWDTVAENIEWVADSEFSYDIELHKHPEMGELCMGFEEALKERMLKIEAEKTKNKEKEPELYMDFITAENKNDILSLAHKLSDGERDAKSVMRVQYAMFDAKVIMKPPHVVFQNEFGSGEVEVARPIVSISILKRVSLRMIRSTKG